MSPAAPPVARRRSLVRLAEVVGLAVLAYVPFLVSSPGRVSADTKQYLYLDPGDYLSRALYLWDPRIGAGTVPHQQIGYLFPMGPWFWVFEQLGAPDWLAQRLWLGSISFAAALGARWLLITLGTGRAGALAGALVYVLCPYQLAFTAGLSILLLPWAGLPWLLSLTMRAVRRGGWSDPAMFALIVLTIGSVNASALLLAGVGPALWLAVELVRDRGAVRAAIGATARIALLTAGVSLWWIIGLRLQGAYGLPVLQLTESLSVVASASSPDDLLRGLGNWLFYTQDRAGYAFDQALGYVTGGWVGLASFAVPVLALLASVVLRWRHRTLAVLLVVVGTVIGVGAWPYDDPTPYGELWASFAQSSSLGLAFRNSPRVVPVVALGLAVLLAGAVGAMPSWRAKAVAGLAVGATALAAFGPVWRQGHFSAGLQRPEDIPSYWVDAAAALGAGGDATRVLELPGSTFAAYRWGNAVEPVTPGLTDRPYLAREVLPYGSPASVNLLDALDRRHQDGVFEPAALAPVARLLGVGTVGLRADLDTERFGLRSPEELWRDLTDPLAPGLSPPESFGPPTSEAAGSAPSVALFDVEDPVPIVRTAPAAAPIVMAGDGEGIVDAAAGGLVDGQAQVLSLPALDDVALDRALENDADLVLTDTNRRRIQEWFFSVARNKGATEQAGRTAPDPNGFDFRLDPFTGSDDASRTVVEHVGGRVEASADGGPVRPAERAVQAFDGDVRTSWRVGGEDPSGERIVLETEGPVATDEITMVQALDGPRDRVLSDVRLSFDEGEPVDVGLGPASLTPEGQVIRFPPRTIERMEVELVATTVPSFDPGLATTVGLAEVRVGDVRVAETVRLPVDFATRTGSASSDHSLDVVLTRLRADPAERGRQDEELRLDRRFELPTARSFRLAGTARLNPNARDEVLDELLGTTAPGATFSSSSHVQGDLRTRASRAFDGDVASAWSPAMGPQEGQFVRVSLVEPSSVNEIELTVVADGAHSVPSRVRIEVDGRTVDTLSVPELDKRAEPGATTTVRLPFDEVTASELRLVVDEVRGRTLVPDDPNPEETLPVAITEARFGGVPSAGSNGAPSVRCRDDVVQLDGVGVPVLLSAADEGGVVLDIERCLGPSGDPVRLDAGSHRLRTTAGLDSGLDLDRIVLSSDAAGRAARVALRGARRSTSGADVSVTGSTPSSFELEVTTDGQPFWLVLGQSNNAGWQARTSTGSFGPRQLVDGYANGWLVRPGAAGTMVVDLVWQPQRLVWAGLAISSLAVLGCLGILVVPILLRRRSAWPADSTLAEAPTLMISPSSQSARSPWPVRAALAVGTAVVVTAFSRPWIGLIAGLATLLTTTFPPARWPLAIAAPLALVVGRVIKDPELAWLALALLLADLVSRRRPSGNG